MLSREDQRVRTKQLRYRKRRGRRGVGGTLYIVVYSQLLLAFHRSSLAGNFPNLLNPFLWLSSLAPFGVVVLRIGGGGPQLYFFNVLFLHAQAKPMVEHLRLTTHRQTFECGAKPYYGVYSSTRFKIWWSVNQPSSSYHQCQKHVFCWLGSIMYCGLVDHSPSFCHMIYFFDFYEPEVIWSFSFTYVSQSTRMGTNSGMIRLRICHNLEAAFDFFAQSIMDGDLLSSNEEHSVLYFPIPITLIHKCPNLIYLIC